MELLVSCGANVNAEWNGDFPILLAPYESVDPLAIEWLSVTGRSQLPQAGPPLDTLDSLIGTYVRSPKLDRCIDS